MTSAFALPQLPSFGLAGKRALVTGGSKGLGLAAAAALVQAGAHVCIVARNAAELIASSQALTGAIVSNDQQVTHAVLDVTNAPVITQWMSEQAAAHGAFDVLVNNAGTNRPNLLVDTPDADLDAVLGLNINAAFYMAREFARALLAAKRPGSIINISSQMGHVGSPRRTVYCASKHAMEGMTKALAWELGPHGIRVNTLCPTFIETPLTAPMLADPSFSAFVVNKIALGRVGQLEEIMGPIVFLASDASTLVTGSALMVDGGWTAA